MAERRSAQPNAAATAIEVLIVFLATGCFYVSLYGQLPYHDVFRFAAQINSGRFVWDIGHIFLQPVTLLWHRYLGFGETAISSQKHINTFATAAGLAVFYLLMLRLGVPRLQRVGGTVLVAAAFGVMTLAPSGHMKMLMFPFLNGSIFQLTLWEVESTHGAGSTLGAGSTRGAAASDRRVWQAALLLAFAATFHASCLAAAPFAAGAILLISLRIGVGWRAGLRRSIVFAAICGGAFLCLVAFGYVEFARRAPTVPNLLASVTQKEELREAIVSVSDSVGRLVFSTANNFISAPAIGSVMRAWIAGLLPSLGPYEKTLAVQFVPWFATLVMIATIYLRSAWRIAAGATGIVLLAFLCGANAWAIYYNLNDPEHWIALLVPTVLLFLTEFPARLTRILIVLWAIGTASLNLAEVGIPTATFPSHAAEREIRARYGAADLLVTFAASPGTAYLGDFNLPGLHQIKLDQMYRRAGDPAAFFAAVNKSFTQTWQHGGKVVVFDILDPTNWNAPWFDLSLQGLTKQALSNYFYSHYVVVALGTIGGLKAWEVRPAPSRRDTPNDHENRAPRPGQGD